MSCCICYARVYLYQECVSPFFSLTSSNFWPVAFLSLQCQSMAGPGRALLMISNAAGPETTFTPPSLTLHFSCPLSSSLPSTFSSVFSSHTSLFISLYILPHLSFLFPHSSPLLCLLSLSPPLASSWVYALIPRCLCYVISACEQCPGDIQLSYIFTIYWCSIYGCSTPIVEFPWLASVLHYLWKTEKCFQTNFSLVQYCQIQSFIIPQIVSVQLCQNSHNIT